MLVSDLQMQRHARAPEGLALTWDAVPGVARYGLIVGIPDVPLPTFDAIMRGEARAFALVGIPTRYTGAIDLGTPVGAERQYGLIAYRGDGTIVAVPGVRYCPAQDAPRGRDYHLFRPRELERPASALPQSPSAAPQETPLAAGDPWTALRTASSGATPAEREEASAVPAHEPVAGDVSVQAAEPRASKAVDEAPAPAVAATASSLPVAGALGTANSSMAQPNGAHEPQGPTAARPELPGDAPVVVEARRAQDEVTVEAVAAATPTPVRDASAEAATEPASSADAATPPPEGAVSEVPVVAASIAAERPAVEPPAIRPAPETLDSAGTPQVDAAVAATPAEPLHDLAAADQAQEASATPPAALSDLSSSAEETLSANRPVDDVISGGATFIKEESAVEPEEAGNPAAPAGEDRAVAARAVDAAPLRPAAPAPAELVALLDEAEVYLLPQWADYAEAGRLLQQAAAIDAGNARLQALQEQLQRAQHGDAAQGPDALLQEARQALEREDYWQAVDAYEEVLGHYPDNAEAQQGVARARALARWSARMLGAGQDAEQVQRVATEFAASSPDLAARSYASAFGLRPTIVTLHGWLLALAAVDQPETVVETAEHGVQALRQDGRIAADPAQDEALAALRAQIATPPAGGVEQAIKHLTQVLVASSQREPQRS